MAEDVTVQTEVSARLRQREGRTVCLVAASRLRVRKKEMPCRAFRERHFHRLGGLWCGSLLHLLGRSMERWRLTMLRGWLWLVFSCCCYCNGRDKCSNVRMHRFLNWFFSFCSQGLPVDLPLRHRFLLLRRRFLRLWAWLLQIDRLMCGTPLFVRVGQSDCPQFGPHLLELVFMPCPLYLLPDLLDLGLQQHTPDPLFQ